MKCEKLLSVSIAAYNVEGTLDRTLSSFVVDEKHMSQLEVIVVDDGSTDSSAEIAQVYVNKYPDTFRLIKKSNGGHGSTITASLNNGVGRYFKIVDGDDWVDATGICDLLDYLDGCDADLIVSPFYQYDESSERSQLVCRHSAIPEHTCELEGVAFEDGLALFEIVVKRERLAALHPEYAEHCFYVDNEFVMAVILASGTIAYFDVPVSYYRTGCATQSMSIAGKRKHYMDCYVVSERISSMCADSIHSVNGGRKLLADQLISSMTRLLYMSSLMQEDLGVVAKQLKSFEEKRKREASYLYEIDEQSSLVRIARKSPRILFPILRRAVIRKEGQGIVW